MSLNPFALLEKAINEHGSANILKERLELARDKYEKLEIEAVQLRTENNTLRNENSALKVLLDNQKKEIVQKTNAAGTFVEHHGALFKRKASGGYHTAVYCPNCQLPMASVMDELPFRCSRCNVNLSFIGHDLEDIMSNLPD